MSQTHDTRLKILKMREALLQKVKRASYLDICKVDQKNSKSSKEIFVLFPVAMVLHALDEGQVKLLAKEELVTKLLEEGSERKAFNYFSKLKPIPKDQLVPDDVDDTAIVLSSLKTHILNVDPTYVLNLINLEAKPGGPYRTWYISDDQWKDIDPVVNAHLFYMFNKFDIEMPTLRSYLRKCVEDKNTISPYYKGEFFFYWNLTRAAYISNDKDLIDTCKSFINGKDFNRLEITDKFLFLIIQRYLDKKIEIDQLNWLLRELRNDESIAICKDFNNSLTYSYYAKVAWGIEILREEKDIAESIQELDRVEIIDQIVSSSFEIHDRQLHSRYIKLLKLIYKFVKAYDDEIDTVGQSKQRFSYINKAIEDFNHNSKFEIIFDPNEILNHYQYEKDNLNSKRVYEKLGTAYIDKRNFLLIDQFTKYLEFNSSLSKTMRGHFTKYLLNICKLDQLNDDCHDLELDIDQGITTFVNYRIINLKDLTKIRQAFWLKEFPRVYRLSNKLNTQNIYLSKVLHLPILKEISQKHFLPFKKTKSEISQMKLIIKSL